MVNSEILNARNGLINKVFGEICAETNMSRFYSNTYCVLLKLWLIKKAEEEELFIPKEDWFNPEHRNDLLQKVEKFLILK